VKVLKIIPERAEDIAITVCSNCLTRLKKDGVCLECSTTSETKYLIELLCIDEDKTCITEDCHFNEKALESGILITLLDHEVINFLKVKKNWMKNKQELERV
jgi:hypothetical protein